jgi:hypothetical protein
MSNSDVLLDVSVADQSSEVIIIDSDFRVLARGIHNVQLRVPPGIYRGKVRVGDQQSEKLFSVESNEPNNHKSVQLAPLEFSSPIPIQQTSTSREFHQSAICDAATSGGVTAKLGQGAAVIIFLRDTSLVYFNLTADQATSYGKNFEGFVLSKLDGGEPHPLEAIGKLVVDRGYLIASVAVTPGTYVLSRVSSGAERLCLPLVVPAGWSLQVFVSMVPIEDASDSRRADFDGAAMVFDRPDNGFRPDRPDLGVLEVTRQALARGHNVLDTKAMTDLLYGKFENPMMGLLAAHLLLLAKKPDLKLAQEVVTNTGNLIGANYPDLLILSWKLRQLQGTTDVSDANELVESVKGPPMLQLSWHYFMEAYRSLANKGGLDKGISKMASQLVTSSVWVSWLESADYQSVTVGATELGAKDTNSTLPQDTKFNEITSTIARGISYFSKKAQDALEGFNNDNSGELKDSYRDVINDVLGLKQEQTQALISILKKGQQVEPDDVALIFETLVVRIDWKSVVGHLKSVALSGMESHPLTPLQRKLILSLKAAREQFDEDGRLPDIAIWRQQSHPDVPLNAIYSSLKSLIMIAANSDNEHISRFAKAILNASHK